jgi:hypothetical protein
MGRLLAFAFRLCTGLLLGAQAFFAAVAAPAAFPKLAAEQPPSSLIRQAAADLVGRMLAQLDRMTLVLAAAAALCAIALGKRTGERSARLAAAPALLAGLCALFSSAWITPRIHALRELGLTGEPEFGRLHALSAAILAVEMLLLLWALWVAPAPERE